MVCRCVRLRNGDKSLAPQRFEGCDWLEASVGGRWMGRVTDLRFGKEDALRIKWWIGSWDAVVD